MAPTLAEAAATMLRRLPNKSASQEALIPAEYLELESEPELSLFVPLEFTDDDPWTYGKSVAASALRRDVASRIRADADAMSGLFTNASAMISVSVVSSNLFHQRVKS